MKPAPLLLSSPVATLGSSFSNSIEQAHLNPPEGRTSPHTKPICLLSKSYTSRLCALVASPTGGSRKGALLTLLFFLFSSFILLEKQKPKLYIIGDSTVRNTNQAQLGWGTLISNYFDTTKLTISNQAMAGRSTRTFIKEGRWNKVLSTMKKGDFLFMQFGHNEGSRPDTTRAGYRGVLRGTGEDSVLLTWPDSTKEVVHTYGWYIKKFIREAKAKGATPIVLSMIPRNQFKEGKVIRATNDYGKWAKEAAEAEGVLFIDLNSITADKYDQLGPDEVKKFFAGDHTHTNKEGADLNAQSVVEGIRQNKQLALNKYLINP